MNKKHVTSLKLSKQLKAVGVEQTSMFYWIDDSEVFPPKVKIYSDLNTPVSSRECSAFLADECLEALPDVIKDFKWEMSHQDDGYVLVYKPIGSAVPSLYFDKHKSLAEASGQMWLWVIENGYYE